MLFGLIEQVKPDVAEQLRLTAALNPNIADVVTLAVADPPIPRVTDGEAFTRSVGAAVTVTATEV